MLAKAVRFITEPIRVITLYSAPLSAALFTTTKAARTFSSRAQVYITYVFISRLSPLSRKAAMSSGSTGKIYLSCIYWPKVNIPESSSAPDRVRLYFLSRDLMYPAAAAMHESAIIMLPHLP